MKTLATIVNEIPHVKEDLKYYIKLCEKEIKNCDTKKEELTIAIREATLRLQKIDESDKNAPTIG